MDNKHKEAFRKLRQWCKEYEVILQVDNAESILFAFRCKTFSTQFFGENDFSVQQLGEDFNFMEQEDEH